MLELLEDRTLLSLNLTGVPYWQEQGPGPILNGGNLLPNNNPPPAVAPGPVAGAIQAIAADPNNDQIIFVGAANGGIWKTSNAQASSPIWQTHTDQFPSLSIGSLAYSPLDPTGNTLYAGTARVSSARLGLGEGILKTTDGGLHWSNFGANTFDQLNVTSIVPTALFLNDPVANQEVLAATPTVVVQGGVRRGGIYYSGNSGQNWLRISGLVPGLPDAGVSDLVPDPGNTSRFYAALPGQGIFLTTDGGQTWQNITSNLPGVAAAGRIRLSVSAAPTNPVYAAVISAAGTLQGVFRAVPGAGNQYSWQAIGTAPLTNPGRDGLLFFSILADRSDPNLVYVGGDGQDAPTGDEVGDLFVGNAATNSWTSMVLGGAHGTAPHADSRNMVFDADGAILEGDDGGIYRTDPTLRTWVSVNANLATGEIRSVAYDSLNLDIIAGFQDNGVAQEESSLPGPNWTTTIPGNINHPGHPDDGQPFSIGDGRTVATAVGDPGFPGQSVRYFMGNTLGLFFRSAFDGTDTQRDIGNTHNIINPGNPLFPRRNFLAATVMLASPNGAAWLSGLNGADRAFALGVQPELVPFVVNTINPTRLLIGRTGLYESLNRGDNIQNITPAGMGRVTALAYGGTGNEDVILVGTRGPTAQLFLSTARNADGTRSFQRLTGWNNLGGGATEVRGIFFDQEDWHTVYVIDIHDVWRGTSIGTPQESWMRLTGSLRDLLRGTQIGAKQIVGLSSLQVVNVFGHTVILVGTTSGVYRLIDPLANTAWTRFGTGLPNVLVTSLRYDVNEDVLVAGTLGRGAWSITNASNVLLRRSVLTVTFDANLSTARLARDSFNPLLLDVFVNNDSDPLFQVELADIEEIDVFSPGNSNQLIVDSSNGALYLPKLINYLGGNGTSQLIVQGALGDVYNNIVFAPGAGLVYVQGINGGGRGEGIIYAQLPSPVVNNIPSPLTNPTALLDTLRNGLEAVAAWSRDLADTAVASVNLPFLGQALGDVLNGESPVDPAAVGDPAGPAAGPDVQDGDPGTSVLDRMLASGTGGFSLGDIGTSITTLPDLVSHLESVGNVPNGVMVTQNSDGSIRFDMQVTTTLTGTAAFDVPVPGVGLEFTGVADISADVKLHVIFGVDAGGFYIDTQHNPDPELRVSNLQINGSTDGGLEFDPLDIALTSGTLAVDPQFNLAVTLHDPGANPVNGIDDGSIRLGDLSLDPTSLSQVTVSSNSTPGAQNMVFTGNFAVSAVDPSQPLPINVTAPQIVFSWPDLSNPDNPLITVGNPDGQTMLAYLFGGSVGGAQAPPFFGPLRQMLLGIGSTQQTITAGTQGTGSQFLEFSASGQGSAPLTVNLAPGDPNSTDHATLALYDAEGNLLAVGTSPDPNQPAVGSLTANLTAGQVYVLAVFYQAAGANDTFSVTANLGGQQPLLGGGLGLDLTTGQSAVISDSFLTPTIVNYYPLNLLDAGSSATVTITPTGPDANVAATLFRRDQAGDPWQPIATGSGTQAFTLSLTPPAFKSLTDASYLLAVAPAGFDSAARSYTISMQAPLPVLAPPTASPAAANNLLTPPTAFGIAQAEVTDSDPNGTLAPGGQQLFQFRALADGTATLTLRTPGFSPVLAVYDATGTQLLAVASNTTPPSSIFLSVTLPLTVQANTAYLIGVSAVNNQQGGTFDLKIQIPYTAVATALAPLQNGSGVTPIPNVLAGPSQGAKIYRLAPAPGTDFLVIEVDPGSGPDPIQPQVELSAPNRILGFYQVLPGQSLVLPVDVSGEAGPLDLYVAGVAGSDPATVQIGEFALPTTLDPSALTGASVDAVTGSLTDNLPAAGFGSFTGLSYTQPPTAGGTTALSVTGGPGAVPLLALYQESGGVLRLKDHALPALGTALAQLPAEGLADNALVGVAAFALALHGSAGTDTFTVQTPGTPDLGSPVAMVPDLRAAEQNPPVYQSLLKIGPVTLKDANQQDLWRTDLPFNLTGMPQLSFTPAFSAPSLTAEVRAYWVQTTQTNGNKVTTYTLLSDYKGLPSGTTQPVALIDPKINNQTQLGDLPGQTILFRINPDPSQSLGTGTYMLKMVAPTTNSQLYEVSEEAWEFSPYNVPLWNPNEVVGYFPPSGPQIQDVIQNQFGHGEAAGQFTSSQPYNFISNPGGINVFRFWALNPGPVVVKTVPIDPAILTDLRVYKAHFDNNGNVEYLQQYDNATDSPVGWFPTDHTTIDAQTYVNDFDLLRYHLGGMQNNSIDNSDFGPPPPYPTSLPSVDPNPYGTGGNLYYVVVKNLQGTVGHYKLVVDTDSMPLVGNNAPTIQGDNPYQDATHGQVAYIPPLDPSTGAGGAVNLNVYLGNFAGLVGYFPIQLPPFNTGVLAVSSASLNSGQWAFDLFDAVGNPLPGPPAQQVADPTDPTFGYYTFREFYPLPAGTQTVYLRVQSLENTPLPTDAQVGVEMGSSPPTNLPPATFFGPGSLLPTNPRGDATITDSIAPSGVNAYSFQAAAGPLTVQVTPAFPGFTHLTWAVYAGGQLLTWNYTQIDPATMTATLLLPDLRQPLSSPDYAFDTAPYDDVVIYVAAGTLGGSFTLSVQTASVVPQRNLDTGGPFSAQSVADAVLPMRNQDLPINPLTGAGTPGQFDPSNNIYRTTSVTGEKWSQLVVPQDASALTLVVTGNNSNSIHLFHYDLYSIASNGDGGFGGSLIASDTQGAQGADPGIFVLPASVVGGASYLLRVADLADPTAIMTVTAGASESKLNALYPTPPAQLLLQPNVTPTPAYAGPLSYADPSPDGKFAQTNLDPQAQIIPTDNIAFWVGSGGAAHFDFVVSSVSPGQDPNPLIALYRGEAVQQRVPGPVEGNQFAILETLVLVDFINDADTTDLVHYQLNAYLTPGMYVLQVNSAIAEVQVTAALPPYPVQDVVLDPNHGASDGGLQDATTAFGRGTPLNPAKLPDPGLLDNYRTNFYRAVAPVDSLDYFQVTAVGQESPLDPNPNTPSQPAYLTGDSAPLAIWAQANGGFSEIIDSAYDKPLEPSQPGQADIAPLVANPGDQFWFSLSRHDLWGKAGITTAFDVPQSGTPDLVVEPIVLNPDSGQTRIEVAVRNAGYADSGLTTAWLSFTDASQPFTVLFPITSKLDEDPVVGRSSVTHVFVWVPVTPEDTVTYVTNRDQPVGGKPIIEELNYANDSQTVAWSTVDQYTPTVQFLLADPQMSGDQDPGVWGRYVTGGGGLSGPQTDIQVVITDLDAVAGGPHPDAGLLSLHLEVPSGYGVISQNIPLGAQDPYTYVLPKFDFSQLNPTTATNPNLFRAVVTDQFGLRNDPVIQQVLVVDKPAWFSDGTSASITFDPGSHQYNLAYHNAVVDQHTTLDQILHATIPFVGDKDNEFLIEVDAAGSASLDPSQTVNLPVSGHVRIEVMGSTIFDQTYQAGDVSDHLSFNAQLLMDGVSLNAQTAAISFGLHGLDLFNFETPEIPLLALGIPDVVAIQASLQFGIDVSLNGALTIGIDLQHPGHLGLLAPSFIEPSITASASVSGEVTVVGLDLAKLEGSVNFQLSVAYGLDTAKGQLVDLGDFASNAGLDFTGKVWGSLEAKIGPFKVWSLDTPGITFGVSVGGGVTTTDPTGPNWTVSVLGGTVTTYDASGNIVSVSQSNGVVGPLELDPSPNLVIDPSSDQGLYVQVVNVAPGAGVQGNLALDQGSGGTWSALTTLPEGSFVTDPVLALTHDQPGTPAVVVYNALDSSVDPSTLTENQFLTGQGLRWRYFDGSSWTAEQGLAGAGLYNSAPAMSFNQAGQGVVAWTVNTNPTPVDATGHFDRTANEIEAAVWDPTSHTWGAPQPLTNNTVSDWQPAVFADPSGKLYAVWLEDAASGNQVMYSSYNGSGWSSPAVLPMTGLPPGGTISQLAFGGDQAGRLDVVMAYSVGLPGGLVEQSLYNRPSTSADFDPTRLHLAAPVELVAGHADFSHLRTLQTPDGGLLLYWQQSDGVTNEVFASKLDPRTATWSAPMRLTNDNNPAPGSNLPPAADLAVAPSVAIDSAGRYQVVYEQQSALANHNPGTGPLDVSQGAPTVGSSVGTSTAQDLPELIFSQPLFFPFRQPTAITLQPNAGNGQVLLIWKAAPGAASYNIYRGTTSRDEMSVATGVTTNYYLDTGLTNDTTYYYQISAVYGTSPGPRSAEVSATPQLSPPPAPTSGQFTPGDRMVSLSWSASPGATSYNIYRGTSSFGEVLFQAGLIATTFTDVGLLNGALYFYQISAVNDIGEGPRSGEIELAPEGPTPSPPINLEPPPGNAAPSGSTVTAQARITNRGLAGTQVQLVYIENLSGGSGPIQVGSDNIYLAPGQTYDIAHAFVVQPGACTYSISATAAVGQEVTGPTGHISSATLVGLTDIAVGNISLSDPAPYAGETVNVTAEIDNLSNVDTGSFAVGGYQGDPNFTQGSIGLLGSIPVSDIGPFGQAIVSFPWTVPPGGGNFLLTIHADPGNQLQDANPFNNVGHLLVSILPDAAVASFNATQPVQATLLNYSGVNNVTVQATISNLGRADLTNVPVELMWALDDGSFQPAGSTVIASLPERGSQIVTFIANGLAGDNRYRVVVDPNGTLPDANPANNVAETTLPIKGLPNLSVGTILLTPPAGGNGFVLTAQINNTGIAAAAPVPVQVFVMTQDSDLRPYNVRVNGQLVGQGVLDRVGPLASADVTVSLTPFQMAPGDLLCLLVDPLNTILMTDHTKTVGCIQLDNIPPNLVPDLALDPNGVLTLTSRSFGQFNNDMITFDETPQGGVQLTYNGEVAQFYPGLVTAVVVNENDGNDAIHVLQMPAGVPLTINGGAGAESYAFGDPSHPLTDLQGPVTLNPGLGANSLLVDASGTPIPLAATVDLAPPVITQLGFPALDASSKDAAKMTIHMGSAVSLAGGVQFITGSPADSVNLQGLPTNAPFTLTGTSQGSLTIGGADGLDDIHSNVSIHAPATLTLNDQPDRLPAIYTLTASSLMFAHPSYLPSGFGNGLTINFPYNPSLPTTILGGSGGNTFNVDSVEGGHGTSLVTGGNDTVNLGNGGSVQGILDAVSIIGSGTTLIVDDSADPAPRSVTMTPTSITGLAPGMITYSGIANLTVDGGFGGNTIGVQNTAAGTNTTLNSGNGLDVVYVQGTTGPLNVNTQQGNAPGGGVGFDSVIVGALIPNVGYTLDSIQGALTVNTSQGYGNLGLYDTAATASEQYTLTSDTITRSGMAPIHYLVTNELFFFLGSGGDNVNVLSTYPGLTTVFEGGVGNDTFNVGDSANTLNGIQGHLSFQIANPGSRVVLNDQGNPAAVNYTFASTLTGVGVVPSIARSSSGYLFFYSGPLQQLILNTSTGGDTVNVQSVPSPTGVTINGAGTDKVNIGNATDGVSDIQGAVNITNNPAAGDYTALTVDDSAYNRGYWWSTLTASSLTTTRRTDSGNQVQVAPINFNQNDLSSLKILLGNTPGVSGNIVSVADTPNNSYPGGMRTTITSGIGAGVNDAIYIGRTTGPLTVNLNNDGLHPASSAFLGAGIRTLDNIHGAVTVNSLSGWTDVVLNDSANPNGETYTITNTTVAFRPNLPVLTYHVSNELEFDAGFGVNTIDVNSTSAATVVVAGLSGQDVVNVGDSSNRLNGITGGYLGVEIAKPGSQVIFNDQGNQTSLSYTFTTLPLPGILRTDGASQNTEIFYTGPLASLTLNGSSGGDTYNIQNTFVPTFIHNHAKDTVTVSNAGSVQNILGPLTVDAANTMVVDDSADPTARTVTMTPTSITGLAPAAVNYGPGVTRLTVNGGYGGNTIIVKNTAAGTNTTVNAGNGVDLVYVEGTTGPLTVNTQEQDAPGFDSVWIGYDPLGYTLDSIQGAVTVNTIGRPGIDYANLAIDDSAEKSPEQYTITNHTIMRSGAALITYTVTNELDFLLGSGGNTVDVQSLSGLCPTLISGGVGNDTFNVGDTSNTLNGIPYQFIIQIANPGSQVNLNDQGNSNNLGYTLQPVIIHRTSTLSWPAYQLLRSDWDPSGHTTFVDVTGPLQNWTLNTGSGNDTFNGGGLPPYSNTQVAIHAGTGVNTLQGPNAANTWQVTGPNAGTLDSNIGFTSIQNLTGGAQADSFVVQNGGGVSGTIDGAGGSDSYTVYLGSLAPPVLTIADSGPSTDSDTLTVKAAPGTNYIVKTATQVTWGNPPTETINYSGIENLIVDLSAGSNNTVIDPGSQNTTIIGGPGTNNITIANTVGNGVVFQDGGGSNNITIDMGNLLGPVTLDGTTGTTHVTIVAPAGSNVLTLSGIQLSGAGETINFNLGTTLANLAVDGSAGQNQLVLQGAPPGPLAVTNVIVGTTTAASPSANPASFGQPLTLTAAVTALVPAAGTPTGTVDFFDTTTSVDLGQVALAGGASSLTTADLPLGNNTITVSYGGATGFLASTTSLTVNILSSIVVLDPAVAGALSLSGSAGIIEPGNVWVDSSNSAALRASGNASLSASSIQVVGGVSRSGNASFNPAPVTGAAALPDPLAGLAAPSGGAAQGSVNLTQGALTINPGIYSSIKVSGSGSLTLNPGIYVLAGGGLTVTANASISGSGVLLYNAGSNFPNGGGNFGGITLSGNGSVTLSAAATGTYAGIVLFQSRDNTRALSLGGSAVLGLTGVIYAPSAQVLVSGTAQLNASLVVDRLTLSGNGISTQVADGAAGSQLDNASAGTLLAGDRDVYVNDPSGYFTANEQARIQDAINAWDNLLAPYSVLITEVSDPTLANVVIDNSTTSAAGTAAAGVLGCYNSTGEITILQGWNWYDGSDPTQVGSGQYDFQTVVTHELGHALGLGGSADSTSPMFEVLPSGVARRSPTVADLNIPEEPSGADAEWAGPPPSSQRAADRVVAWASARESRSQAASAAPAPIAQAISQSAKDADPSSWPLPAFPAPGSLLAPIGSSAAPELVLDPNPPELNPVDWDLHNNKSSSASGGWLLVSKGFAYSRLNNITETPTSLPGHARHEPLSGQASLEQLRREAMGVVTTQATVSSDTAPGQNRRSWRGSLSSPVPRMQALQLTDLFFVALGAVAVTSLRQPGDEQPTPSLREPPSARRKAATDAVFTA